MTPSYYLVRTEDTLIYAKTELEFTRDHNEATRFKTIGDAMRLAGKIVSLLGTNKFTVYPIYEPWTEILF